MVHTTDTHDYRWDIPTAMQPFYDELRMMGFVNRTAPTPDEWDHPAGMQVRINHVARETTIRYRETPPEPIPPIKAIDAARRYEQSFRWNETKWPQNCPVEQFRAFLARVSRTIGTELTMRQSQSRT